jgi:transposase
VKQKRYDSEFKRDAVELLLRSGKPLKPLAKELGVSDTSLRLWRDTYFGKLEGGFRGTSGELTSHEMAEEIRRLRKEVDTLRRQREILKKALSILSDQSPGGML